MVLECLQFSVNADRNAYASVPCTDIIYWIYRINAFTKSFYLTHELTIWLQCDEREKLDNVTFIYQKYKNVSIFLCENSLQLKMFFIWIYFIIISFILPGNVPLRYRYLLPGSPGQNGSTESFTYRLDTHRTRQIVKNKKYHPTS